MQSEIRPLAGNVSPKTPSKALEFVNLNCVADPQHERHFLATVPLSLARENPMSEPLKIVARILASPGGEILQPEQVA